MSQRMCAACEALDHMTDDCPCACHLGDLTDTEIVDRINRVLSLTTFNIATDPENQPQYLSEFAMTVNDVLSRRAETQYR